MAQEFLNSLTGGLASGKIQLTQVGQDTAESVKSGAESVDATQSGTLFGTQYATGVKATTGKNNIAANGVAKAAKTGIELIKALASGTAFGNQYATGIQGKRGSANSAGAALGSSAKSGAGYANPTQGRKYIWKFDIRQESRLIRQEREMPVVVWAVRHAPGLQRMDPRILDAILVRDLSMVSAL